MNISSLLNPASPPGTDRDTSSTSGEYHNPRIQQQPGHGFGPRYDQNHEESPLLHPQPVRPVMAQSNLGRFGDSRYLPQPQPPIRSPAGPIQQMFAPGHQHRAGESAPHTAHPLPSHPTLDTSPEGLNRVFSWQIGDPIPRGMRLTVPSYVTIQEPPHHQRILIPANESAESLRPFLERPVPVRHVGQNGVIEGCNLPEHHSALLRMKEPDPIPFSFPITMPQRPGTGPGADNGPSSGQASATELQKQKIQDQRPSIDQALVANTTKEVVLVEFEQVMAHTAKCDLCNARNKGGMSRCLSCGWQSCHTCTIARSCFRTHHAGGRIHTGPVDKDDLVVPEKAKAKKGGKLRVLKDTAARKAGKLTKSSGGGKSRKSWGASSVAIGKDVEGDSGSEREALLAGARNLYALGAATLEAMNQEEAEANSSRLNSAKAAQHGNASDGDSPDSDPADPDYDPMQIDTEKPARKSTRRVTY